MKIKLIHGIKMAIVILFISINSLFFAHKYLVDFSLHIKNQLFDFSLSDLVINTVVYLFSVLILIKFIKYSMNVYKKRKKIILIGFCSIYIIFNTLIVSQFYMDYVSSKYNYKIWINKPDKRVHMINDMFEKIQLIGMSKDEVIRLLGKPEEITDEQLMVNDEEVDVYSKYALIYYIGPVHASYDGKWLYIKFDKNDSVIKYKIFTFVT